MSKRALRRILLALAITSTSVMIPIAAEASPALPGEPWLGLAKVGTQTCPGGSCGDRVYTLSIEDVTPFSVSGDRAVWDYAPGTPLTLRLEWDSAFGGGGVPSGLATTMRVSFRYFGGGQIGTSYWDATIPAMTQSGVLSPPLPIHLDDNPMDGVVGVPQPGVIFEIYGQLLNGTEHNADTRGTPASFPAGSGSYARGLLSSGGLVLYDHWNAADGSAWKTSKWVTNSNGGSRTVDVQGNQGRMHVVSSSARGTAQMADIADAEVNLVHEFCAGVLPCVSDRNSGSELRISLRGSGATGANQMPNAYRLDIASGSDTVKIKKLVGGTATTIPGGTFTYNPDGQPGPDPGRHRVRFRVQGSEIKAAVWPANLPEPDSWDLEVSDTAVTVPGKLQVAHSYSSGTARSVYLEDLTLFNLSCSGCSNHFQDFPPTNGANGHKVYLSPETNPTKTGCEGYNERQSMRDLASRTAARLADVGYQVRVGLGRNFDENIATSKEFKGTTGDENYVHVPVHSNGKGFDACPATATGEKRGTLVMFDQNNAFQETLARRLFDELYTFRPESERAPGALPGVCASQTGEPCPGKNLKELRVSGLGVNRAYIEVGYHDWMPEKDWILSALDRNFGHVSVEVRPRPGSRACR